MFYVKQTIGDYTEIKIEITDENVFTRCPVCGVEHKIDLQDILVDGDSDLCGTTVYCQECDEPAAGEPQADPMLLTVRQAVEVSGIGRNRILDLIKTDPKFPYVRVGSYYRINRQMLQEYLNEATKQNRAL